MRFVSILALAAGVSAPAAFGGVGLPLAQFDYDIDGNGTTETEGTWLRRSLGLLSAGSQVSFSYAFMTDESGNADPYNDVFRVRLHDAAGQTLAQFGGAVDNDSYNAGPDFVGFDFDTPDLAGAIRTPPGMRGLLWFATGLIGWNEMTLTVPTGLLGEPGFGGEVFIEFLVADSTDHGFESALAIDNIVVETIDRSGVGNGGFEDGLAGWEFEGEALALGSLFQDPNGEQREAPIEAFFAAEGGTFALITTERVPAPGAATLGGLALLTGLRRRR